MRRAPTRRRAARRGVTLVELLVVLVLLGVVAGVVGLAIRRAAPVGAGDEATAFVSTLRGRALAGGRAVTATYHRGDDIYAVTALPDGRVLADPGLAGARTDALTGGADARPR